MTGGEESGKAQPEDDRAQPFDFSAILGIADILPVMIAYLDQDFRYVFVNKPYSDWIEKPRSEILGRTAAEVVGQEAFLRRRPQLEGALAGKPQRFLSHYDHPNRGPLTLQAEYVPQFHDNGQVLGIAALIRDVTEQRAAELALKESEDRFRRIANQAPVLMWVTRLDRTRDFVNDAYVEFLGKSRGDARTFDWREAIHPDDVDRIVAESVAGEASRQAFTLEGRYLRHDGEYRWLRSVSSPRFGPDGELAGFIGAGTDITLTKETEQELKRQVEEQTAQLGASEAQFRAVFEAALEVMVLLKPDGTVIAVNNRQEVWRHPDPAQAIGMKLWDAPTMKAYPQHIEMMREGVARAANGDTFTAEVRMDRPGVPTAYLDVSVQPVRSDNGEIIYLLFEARDMTELKAAQEQLRQSQKMEALGQLTGGIAHDFNNLLTVVVGGLDLISKRVGDQRLKRYAVNALTAAERGAKLTGQLLAFSRVQRLEVRPTSVAPLVENMRPLLRNVLGPGIEKIFSLGSGLPAALADPTQLEVAILNLAINARDAMPDGGILTFESRGRRIKLDPELDPGDYIELTISDTGTGMPAEVAERAFDPFFTTKEVGKGTGLGLSMVYGMARQSGGTARIRSDPGKGTSVAILLRASGSVGADVEPVDNGYEELVDGSDTASVLVIDDDPDVRGFIAEALADQGFDVREAGDGFAGLEAFASAKPDVVVLDFLMPGMSGAEVARQMRDEHPDQPILFVSGYSETDAIEKAAPGTPLLTKPFRSDVLTQAVRSALSARTAGHGDREG